MSSHIKPDAIMPPHVDSAHHNTSSVVGEAIHKTEQKIKTRRAEKEMLTEADRVHEAREEQLLREQRAKLRKKERSDGCCNPDGMQANSGHLPSEFEAVRQHLRHVGLEEQKGNDGCSNRVLDYTNNNVPNPYSVKDLGISNVNGKGTDEKMMKQRAHSTVLNKDGPDSNGYHFIMPVQDSDEKNTFEVYAEIHDDPRSRSIADSSSVSSSSYYADIEEVTKEMQELADNQAEFIYDEKF